MLNAISWNIGRRDDAWRMLLDTDADIALLQEACKPPADIAAAIGVDAEPWHTAGAGFDRPWRTAVVKLSNRVEVDWLIPAPLADVKDDELAVSRLGTLAAARIRPLNGEPLIAISLYGVWEKPHRSMAGGWNYADGSVHRLISDVSALVGQQAGHRILAAGDLNVLNRYGENRSTYWGARYTTVFERMEALGLSFVGPSSPLGGRQADPWPDELPHDSRDVPTFHHSRQTPETASRQLDFVFASSSMSDGVEVRALNEKHEWGPSDHCRLEISLS